MACLNIIWMLSYEGSSICCYASIVVVAFLSSKWDGLWCIKLHGKSASSCYRLYVNALGWWQISRWEETNDKRGE